LLLFNDVNINNLPQGVSTSQFAVCIIFSCDRDLPHHHSFPTRRCSDLPESKSTEPIYETHHNGWSFLGFEVGESDLKSNLLPYNNIDKFKTNLLIKCFDNNNFEKIYDYVGVPTIKIRDKKIVYIGDVEHVIYCDEKLLFKESNELSVESEFNEIFIPKIPLYESNNFRIEFFLNEVKKYMSILFLLPQDEVIFNFKFMNGNKIVKWSDVSEKNILELILN